MTGTPDPPNTPPCPSGKTIYPDRKAARKALQALVTQRVKQRSRKVLTLYPCRGCGFWHIGHSRGKPRMKEPKQL